VVAFESAFAQHRSRGERELIDQIAKCRICRYLTKSQLPDLMDYGAVQMVNKGTRLFEEGHAGDRMFAILSGGITILKREKDGTEKTLTMLGPGDTIGEMSLVDNQPRSASATVFADTTLFQIDRAQLAALVKSRPDIASRLLWAVVETISARLRQTEGLYQAMLARALSAAEEVPKAEL
jgi:CRP/FNR family cyclic AMP-dependent transcriptional regulator